MQAFKRYLIRKHGKRIVVQYPFGVATWGYVSAHLPITANVYGKYLPGTVLAYREVHAMMLNDAAGYRYDRERGGHWSYVQSAQELLNDAVTIRLQRFERLP